MWQGCAERRTSALPHSRCMRPCHVQFVRSQQPRLPTVARYRYWYGVSDPVRWTADFETFAHRALNRTARAEHYRIAHPHALPAGAITGDGSVMLGYDPDAPALLRHLLPQARTASR